MHLAAKNTFFKGGKILALAILLLAFSFEKVRAGLLRIESQSFFSIRRDDDQSMNYPFFEFFEAAYRSSKNEFYLNTNFGVSIPEGNSREFSLYILDAAYRPWNFLALRAGRSFNVQAAKKGKLTDSVSIDLNLWESRLGVMLSAGVEREALRASLKSTTRFIGASINYRDRSMFPLYMNATYTYRRLDLDPKSLDQQLLGLSAQKMLPFFFGPEILANSEMKVSTPKRLNLVEGGFNFYPSYRTILRLRGMAYESNSNDDVEDPIFSIFSLGRLYEGSAQLEFKLMRFLSTSASGSLDEYEYQEGKRTRGYRAQWGLIYARDFLSLTNSLYYFKSYGGRAIGDRVVASKRLSDRFDAGGAFDSTYYEKITSSKTWALNSEAWAGYRFLRLFRLSTGVELNRNNALRYDFRFVAKLNYLLWSDL